MEEWRPIPNWGDYDVSHLGRIRSRRVKKVSERPKILTTHASRDPRRKPYKRVTLFGRLGRRRWQLHQLVMLTFVGECPPGLEINHKDGDPSNNAVSNLEYVTKSQNQQHRVDVLGFQANRGEEHGMAILSDANAAEILRLCRQRIPQKEIAAQFGVSVPTVSMISRRKTWRHLENAP